MSRCQPGVSVLLVQGEVLFLKVEASLHLARPKSEAEHVSKPRSWMLSRSPFGS